MKRRVAQLEESTRDDYDPEERGEVTAVGEHHGGSFGTYFAHKVTKLRQQHQPVLSGDKSTQIFRGCIMYVNGLTELPIEELRRLISLHGGEHIMYRAVKITHYVCNHFTDAQLKHEYAKVKLNAKNKVYNVTVAWVLESIQQMKRLNENLYVPKGLTTHGGVLTKSFFGAGFSSNSGKGITDSKKLEYDATSNDLQGSYGSVNSSSSSSSSSSSNSGVDATSTGTELTLSQEAFLESIPEEFRADALVEIASVNRTKAMDTSSGSDGSSSNNNRNVSRGNSNSSSFSISSGGTTIARDKCTDNADSLIDLTGPESAAITLTSATPSPVLNEAAVHRRDALHSMIHSIHYTTLDTLCGSTAVLYNIKEYIRSLLMSARIDGLVEDPGTIAYTVVQLLTDYAIYLKGKSQFDQVEFLMAELRRQCTTADVKTATHHNNTEKSSYANCQVISWCDVYSAVCKKVSI